MYVLHVMVQLLIVLIGVLKIVNNVINMVCVENVKMIMYGKIIDVHILIFCFSMISNIQLVEVLIYQLLNGGRKKGI